MQNFPESVFNTAQREALSSLNREQWLWVAGYSSGFVAGGLVTAAPQAVVAPVKATVFKPSEVTILYGTESGNTEALAAKTRKAFEERGVKALVRNMADTPVDALRKVENLLVIVSTWGEGDPPQSAEPFYKALLSEKAPRLEKTRFSVCSLGDTSYEHFCRVGKTIDARLAELGASRVSDRVDCDVSFDAPFAQWLSAVLAALMTAPAAAVQLAVEVAAPAAVAKPAVEFGKKNPFPAPLKEKILLNGRGSSKETYHYEIQLDGSGMSYEPGDALALVPENDPAVADEILRIGKFNPEETIDLGEGESAPLREALIRKLDITGASTAFLRKFAAVARNPELDALMAPERKDALKDFLNGRQIVDVLEKFGTSTPVSGSGFAGSLRKLPPRLYSIASSLKAHPGEVHLTVATVRYQTHGRSRSGVASCYLADRRSAGDSVSVYIHNNKNFRLPEKPETPIIMVGPGTGVAPFRAFIEERAATGASGKNWLFFGDQHFLTDFLYQTEWQEYLEKGKLNRLDVAFSRDQPEKIYVQHKMLQARKELWRWMQEGASFYVCGDASRMAGDVNEALIQIAQSEGALTRENAEAWVADLKKQKRYQRDVY